MLAYKLKRNQKIKQQNKKVMGNILRAIDQLGDQVTLKWGRKERLQTTIGGITTFILIIIVAGVAINLLSKAFDNTNVEVSISTQYSEFFPRYDIIEAGFFPTLVVSVGGKDGLLISPDSLDRYITVEMETVEIRAPSTPGNLRNKAIRTIHFKPCSQIQDKYKEKYYHQQNSTRTFTENLSLCPDFQGDYSNFFVSGNMINPPRNDIWLRIYPCTLADSTQCAPLQEIALMGILITLPKVNFEPANYDNPYVILPDSTFQVLIQPSTYKVYQMSFKNTKIYDDAYDFFEKTEQDQYQEIDSTIYNAFDRNLPGLPLLDCTGQTSLRDTCYPYVMVSMTSGGQTQVTVRTYNKILEALGEIGGFWDLTVLMAGLLLGLFVAGRSNDFLIRETLNTTWQEITKTGGLRRWTVM